MIHFKTILSHGFNPTFGYFSHLLSTRLTKQNSIIFFFRENVSTIRSRDSERPCICVRVSMSPPYAGSTIFY